MAVVFTDQEKEQILYHLGYLETSPAASLTFGQPRPIETLFLVESAINLVVSEFAGNRIRRILNVLEGVECRLVAAQDRLAAKSVDNLVLNEGEPDKLEREYYRWAGRLADVLGVPLYFYSERFKQARGMGAGSIPVVG